MNFYIADLHLGHENIMRLSRRPFNTLTQMHSAIINNWNSRVTDSDTVYILGDIAFKAMDIDEVLSLIRSLNGKKVLVEGNHDVKYLKNRSFRALFEEITPYKKIYDNDRQVILSHYPFAEWDGFFRGSYHCYGHIHNNINETSDFMLTRPNAFNVGVDVIGFSPATLDELIALHK